MPAPNRSKERQHPWEREAESEAPSFGAWLRRQREVRQIALREIADVTKISMRYLEALEQDRFDILPAGIFAKGFLKEYARYVGLDPDEVVNSYLIAQAGEEVAVEEEILRPPKRSSWEWTSGVLVALAVGVLLALIAFLAFQAERSKAEVEAEPPSIAAPVMDVIVEQPPPPQPQSESLAPLLVTMDFTENCWVEVTVDGQRDLSKLYVQGESLSLEANERVVLTLGNPAGVHIEVNGEVFDTGPADGRVARNIEIDLASLNPIEPIE